MIGVTVDVFTLQPLSYIVPEPQAPSGQMHRAWETLSPLAADPMIDGLALDADPFGNVATCNQIWITARRAESTLIQRAECTACRG